MDVMKKIYIIIISLIISVSMANSQTAITGKVSDKNGNALAGVEFYFTEACIRLAGVSDSVGNLPPVILSESTGKLFYRYSGEQEYFGSVSITGNVIDLTINENDQVVNLGHGILTSEIRSAQSFATINRTELLRSSESDVKKALYGQLPGLFVMQPGSVFGSPGMTIRGRSTFGNNSPLVLVDGFERNLDYFSIEEIESVTILKDAVSAALYGVRGANGVIVVTTRRGNSDKPRVQVRYNNNQYMPFRPVEMAGAPAYARALNEALFNDGLPERYSAQEIAAFESGVYPYAYPDVNWQREVFNERPVGHLFDFSVRGGRERFKYFSAISYSNAGGYYNKVETTERNDHNYSNSRINVRANVDVNITSKTLLKLGLLTHLSQQQAPGSGAGSINNSVFDIPSAAFPVYSGEEKIFASNAFYAQNPLAMVNYSGFSKSLDQALFYDMRLNQDLSAILPGLTAYAAVSYDFRSLLNEGGSRNYLYEVISAQIVDNTLQTSKTSFGEDSPMDYFDNISNHFINNNIEGGVNYSRSSTSYQLNTSLIYEQSFYFSQGRNNTDKRQAYKAFGSLVLENKYLIDAVLNYSGSSKLPEGDRFRLYPAVSAAWIVSNEPFFGNAESTILKVRGSYGVSGSDLFSHDLYRYFLRGGGAYYLNNTINSFPSTQPGILPPVGLNYETARKADLGFDLSLFNNKLILQSDFFYENRTDILVTGSTAFSGVLGFDVNEQPDGIINTKGIEAILSLQDQQNNFAYKVSGNFTFARATVIENNEGFLPYDYLSRKGNSINAMYGLEALGFFRDSDDIADSPLQAFGDVSPGDIKYKNQNPGDDDFIDQLDVKKLSDYGAIPEIYFGLDSHLKYKGLGFYALLQGVANRSLYTNSRNIFFPLRNNTNISTWYLDERTRWTPANADVADAPRLTTEDNANNFRFSDIWLENGSYLKLRNIEVYYDLALAGFQSRLYVRGANLFSLDKLKYFDPENYSIGYPSLSSYTLGMQISF